MNKSKLLDDKCSTFCTYPLSNYMGVSSLETIHTFYKSSDFVTTEWKIMMYREIYPRIKLWVFCCRYRPPRWPNCRWPFSWHGRWVVCLLSRGWVGRWYKSYYHSRCRPHLCQELSRHGRAVKIIPKIKKYLKNTSKNFFSLHNKFEISLHKHHFSQKFVKRQWIAQMKHLLTKN